MAAADVAVRAALDAYFLEVKKTREADAKADAESMGSPAWRSSAEYRSRRHMHVAYRLIKETRPTDAAHVLRALLDEGYAALGNGQGPAGGRS